ncbi:hypothetical protein M422DRAFT_253449 [Sphaerobolus stellatus SS14]|uniref:Uncharacterized protein n=1 Tax=Sphaerobolus stellatus (strain SS14) TaxID=990650 RepID=A0A0C9VMW1_SPHS4|nr:hypothetical protein M422DRAFT_253449 [Sphaerobolus stellatus SS14]
MVEQRWPGPLAICSLHAADADCRPLTLLPPIALLTGTICLASDRTPFDCKDPAKKLKVLDLNNYLNKDIKLPPSLTRTTTRNTVFLGADILEATSQQKNPLTTPGSPGPPHHSHIFPMSQDNSTATNTGDIIQVPPQDQGTAGSTSNALRQDTAHRNIIRLLPTGSRTTSEPTLERIMYPITPNHQRDWRSLNGNKILALISRLKVTRNAADRVAAMSALERLLLAFSGNVAIDIGPADNEIRVLKKEFVLANEEVAVFFYPYDTALPITEYAVSLEGLVLTPSTANDTRTATEPVCFLSMAGEFIQFINQHHDNIPFKTEPNPNNSCTMCLSTPPTIEPAAYKSWISLLHCLHYDTRKGSGKQTAAELCNVCKLVAHSDDTCKYAAVPGWPATAPSPPPLLSSPIPPILGVVPLVAGVVVETLDMDAAVTQTLAGPNQPPHTNICCYHRRPSLFC